MPTYADQISVHLLVDIPGAGPIRLTDEMIEQMTTTEQPGETCMRLDAVIPVSYTTAGSTDSLLPLNGHLRLIAYVPDPIHIMDFAIRDREYIDDGRPRTRITAYDPMWELNKDECIYFMSSPQNPAVSIVRRVLEDRGVPIGSLPGPSTLVRGLRFASPTRMALINQVLMWGFQHADKHGPDGEPYFAQWRNGTFNLVQPGKNVNASWVRDKDSVAYFSHRTDMQNFVSEVFVMGPDAMQIPSGSAYDFINPFTALVPNPRVDYNALLNLDPANPPEPAQLIAQEAVDLFQLAQFQKAQQYAHIRKIIQADTGNPLEFFQQALDILFIQGLPWDVRQIQTSILPWLRRGDALLVTAGTMHDTIGIVTGVEHDYTNWVSHVTMDSSGILGRRVRRQNYTGPLPGGDLDILPGDRSLGVPIAFQAANPGGVPDPQNFRLTVASGLVERFYPAGTVGYAKDTWVAVDSTDPILETTDFYVKWQAAIEAGKSAASLDPTMAAPTLIPDVSQYIPGSSVATPTDSMGAVSGWVPSDPSGAVRQASGWNPSLRPVTQTMNWTCSAASTAWLLQSIGFDLTEIQVKDALGSGRVNATSGLADHTGRGLADLLSGPPFNLHAHYKAMTYDEALASAGTKPIVMGSVTWNHWTGVRGRDGDNIALANPAPNYGGPYNPPHSGTGDSLPRNRLDLGTGGLFDVVWVDP